MVVAALLYTIPVDALTGHLRNRISQKKNYVDKPTPKVERQQIYCQRSRNMQSDHFYSGSKNESHPQTGSKWPAVLSSRSAFLNPVHDRHKVSPTAIKRGDSYRNNVIYSEESEQAGSDATDSPATLEQIPSYSTDDIVVLEGFDAVRKRPGMYIGNTGESGVHQLLFEILDNAVDEYMAGACNKITVTLKADGSAVIVDNGRGIPCDVSEKTKKSGLETVLTVLHSGGKFNDDIKQTGDENPDEFLGTEVSRTFRTKHIRKLRKKLKDASNAPYEYSSGLHGVGLSVVNALSKYMRVEVYKGTKVYSMELSCGKIVQPLTIAKGPKRTGTCITFLPDYEQVFKIHHNHTTDGLCKGCRDAFDLEKVRTRIEELSYINPMLTLTLIDERKQNDDGTFWEETFMHTGGTREFLQDMIKDRTPLYKSANIINIRGKSNGVEVEASLSWSAESYVAHLKGFANNVSTVAGTHIEGLKAAITKAVNHCCRRSGFFKAKAPSLSGEFIREGLTAIISVKLMGAEFDGQTKSKLGNQIARTAVERIVAYQMIEILEKHPQLLIAIYNKSLAAKKAFEAAKHAKELVRQKNANFLTTGLPAKLSDCTSNDMESSEIFIVEGESAAGNAKQARNRRFQAVLPLKGKILNIEKINSDLKVMENEEIKLLISSLGLSVNPRTWRQDNMTHVETMVPTGTQEIVLAETPGGDKIMAPLQTLPLRYGKIILLTDADIDGAHLRILLLGLLFRICPQLYEHGRVYTACPPLFRITNQRRISSEKHDGQNKSVYSYAWSEDELPEAFGQAGSTKLSDNKMLSVQRFKGLGEMMAQQLWDTTMDPEKRMLRRISVQDGVRASKMLELLMGSDVQSRKEFIFNKADNFQLQDLDL